MDLRELVTNNLLGILLVLRELGLDHDWSVLDAIFPAPNRSGAESKVGYENRHDLVNKHGLGTLSSEYFCFVKSIKLISL